MSLTKQEQWVYENCNEKDTVLSQDGYWEIPAANKYNIGQIIPGIFEGTLLQAIQFIVKYAEVYPHTRPLDITRVQMYSPEDTPALILKATKQEAIITQIKVLQAELRAL